MILENKSVLITGGAAGLGLAAALDAAREGARLTLVDINSQALDAARQAVLAETPAAEVLTVPADVSREEDVQAYVDAHVEAYGGVDGFFNNAGIEGRQNLTENYTNTEFQRVLAVNLTGVFLGMEKVLKVMAGQGHGQIVNCASVGGIRGVGDQSGYSASKHGVVGLTRNSAVEYGAQGISINAIAPGAFMTDMVEGSLRQMGGENWQEVGREFVAPNPMRRFGDPAEIGALVSFLLSGRAAYINGSILVIDGGQHARF